MMSVTNTHDTNTTVHSKDACEPVLIDSLATLSHELKTPLHSIVSCASLLQEQIIGPLTLKQKEYVEIISENATYMMQMARQMMDMAALEKGIFASSPALVRIKLLLNETTAVISPLLAEKQQKCVITSIEPLPETLYCDKVQVKQVLLNLLTNAHKYSPRQSNITIRVFVENDRSLVFSVHDTGCGISPKELESIFQPFYRGTCGNADDSKGVGLGLTVASKIMECHHGSIRAQSSDDKGTEFQIRFPLDPPKTSSE